MIRSLKSKIGHYRSLSYGSDFIPTKQLALELDLPTLKSTLLELGASEDNSYQYAQEIMSRFLKTFLILLAIDAELAIIPLIATGWNDSYLPMDFPPKSDLQIHIFSPHTYESFSHIQWRFISPEFRNPGEHLTLDDRAVLPFTEITHSGHQRGNLESVTFARIHPLYQTLYHPNHHDSPRVALKSLPSNCLDLFEHERNMLKHLQRLQVPNVITFLASYKWRGNYYLMLASAQCSLEEFWLKTNPSELGDKATIWTLTQIAALATSLSMIHDFTLSTHPEQSNDDGRHPIGALHADIQPQNILLMRPQNDGDNSSATTKTATTPGDLVFSDFGLSEFFCPSPTGETSMPPQGIRTFEAPEYSLHEHIGRASDVWSFGGVLLEFLVWLVLGRDVLKKFFDERCTADVGSAQNVMTDHFYTITYDEHGKARGAEVKNVVLRYVGFLEASAGCVGEVRETLGVVMGGMLVVDSSQRVTSRRIAETLRRICEDFKASERRGEIRGTILL